MEEVICFAKDGRNHRPARPEQREALFRAIRMHFPHIIAWVHRSQESALEVTLPQGAERSPTPGLVGEGEGDLLPGAGQCDALALLPPGARPDRGGGEAPRPVFHPLPAPGHNRQRGRELLLPGALTDGPARPEADRPFGPLLFRGGRAPAKSPRLPKDACQAEGQAGQCSAPSL